MAVVNNSWSSVVNLKTPPEDVQPKPYENLPGSDVGIVSEPIVTSVTELFPELDGSTVTLPAASRPDEFGEAPDVLDAADFMKWHSAYQLEYIKSKLNGASSLAITGGASDINVMLSGDGKKVYIIENLDKTKIARMTLAEQTSLAGIIPFINRLDDLQLSTESEAANSLVQTVIDRINNMSTPMGADDKKVFTDQLANMKLQLATMKIFSLSEIKTQVDAIEARFKRAEAFAGNWESTPRQVIGPGDDDPPVYYYQDNVVSLDNGATIARGYQIFIAQEKQLLALQNKRLEIAGLRATPEGERPIPGNLDVPTLVYMLQLNYNLQGEAKVAIQTEEINQTNALLKTYAEMQRLVNDTIKEFDVKKQEESRSILGADGDKGPGNIGSAAVFQQNPVLAMFDKWHTRQLHPIEELKNVSRVTQEMSANFANNTLKEWTKATWDTFGSQLADRVTLINQESQIKMNEVNSLDKQKNRHFDLANNALAKMSEILQNIARATS